MNRAAKVAVGVSAFVVAGLFAMAVPTVAAVQGQLASWQVFAQDPEPSEQPRSGAGVDTAETVDPLGDDYVDVGNGTMIPRNSPEGCENPAWLHLGRMTASVGGELLDRGAREFAAGSAGLDAEGAIVTYTVAAGDALDAIAERFCIANALTIAQLNHTRTIHPGEVLLLHPDGSIPWIPYFAPDDAPAGYQQIPYQDAVEAMSTAAQAGDVDAMRVIFQNDLSGLFPNPADADLIANALDVGDLRILRQMFA